MLLFFILRLSAFKLCDTKFFRYKLGPNGAILTALNLFATRFDQVMDFAEKRASSLKYVYLKRVEWYFEEGGVLL